MGNFITFEVTGKDSFFEIRGQIEESLLINVIGKKRIIRETVFANIFMQWEQVGLWPFCVVTLLLLYLDEL